jgi:hypothetical protein
MLADHDTAESFGLSTDTQDVRPMLACVSASLVMTI